MKAVSDVTMCKIIRRLLRHISGPTATYEIGDNPGDYTLQSALIEQASQMKPGEERLVYFYDNIPGWFGEGYGVAKLYYHEGYEQGGTAFVCVELLSGAQRKYMNVVKSDIDDSWYCTEPEGIRDVENRLIKLTQPLYTRFEKITDDMGGHYLYIDDHDLHQSVTEYDEETGQTKRTREVEYFDIWLYSDDDCSHYARFLVSSLAPVDSHGERCLDVNVGYNSRSGKSLMIRVGIDAENFWFVRELSGKVYAIDIKAY